MFGLSNKQLILISVAILILIVVIYFVVRRNKMRASAVAVATSKVPESGGIKYTSSGTSGDVTKPVVDVLSAFNSKMLSLVGKYIYAAVDNVAVYKKSGALVKVYPKDSLIGFVDTDIQEQLFWSKGYLILNSGNIFTENHKVEMYKVKTK